MMDMENLFPMGQIRLAELSVYNWGSFNGLHNASIHPNGTLITGDNGAGKSTLIDALMAVLLPAGRASFNVAAAQGDKSDRSLLSYMRGSYGTAHDGIGTRVKSKREGAVVTALRAYYRADDDSEVSLIALFWTTQASNSLADVKRLYIIAKRNFSLKAILDAFGKGSARALKQRLRDDTTILSCNESFTEYQEQYRKLLYIENKNAPALLARALGLKKIDDLTGLIRELVLEPSTVKEDAKKVVQEFTDLVSTHDKLLDARAQQQHLSRLPDLQQQLFKAQEQLTHLSCEREGLPVYLAELSCKLWSDKVNYFQRQLNDLKLQIERLLTEERDVKEQIERLHESYIQAGGDRIESLKKELGYCQKDLARVVNNASQYQTSITTLGLNNELTEEMFKHNQSQSLIEVNTVEEKTRQAENHFGEVTAQLSLIQNKVFELDKLISEIQTRPNSNIELKQQKLRDELVQSLQLKSEQCMFIGELIDVQESERSWQGAIERALGGVRSTLVVPEHCFSMVTSWLNHRHTGLHVRVQVMQDGDHSDGAQFKDNGFLRKLVWREHPYRAWLKKYLVKFDLACVDTTEILNKTPYSMTQQGLIHIARGRFEKKDLHKIDDRRRWYLGFCNKSRLTILQRDLKKLNLYEAESLEAVKKARESMNATVEVKQLWQELKNYKWEEINVPYWQNKVTQLQSEMQQLESTDGDLERLKRQWEASKELLEILGEKKNQNLKKEGELSKTLLDAQKKLDDAKAIAAVKLDQKVRQSLEKRIGRVEAKDVDSLPTLLNEYLKKIELAAENWRGKQASAERSAIGIMSSFRSHEIWQVIAVDWHSDIKSLDDYMEHLKQLEEEGLPALVEKFTQRLNKHATQSLARVQQRLQSERDDIIERIETINLVLKKTEFRKGTYLRLGTKTEKYPHVIDFKNQVLKVFQQATNETDDETRFSQLALVVGMLEKASAAPTAGTLESLRLLDPRYQMSFFAEELDTETHEIRDVLESSSGKSGGEKESFAGTIVAASLAYVLTPDGCDYPVYSSVFLDEAFSNTAEAVSRRVLRVFNELKIHVNLITPYKNLNLARESASSLLIAERDSVNHDSRLSEITWQEIDRRLVERQQKRTLDLKKQYEIKVEENNE